jgi:acyl-CoA synthetase (AMP-forming)/AMP-acid ligase II
VVVASHLIDADFCATGRKIPIGGPDRGVSFHLVDADGRLITEPGVPGELYVGGVQVMAGYWGAPELTSAVPRDDVVPGTLTGQPHRGAEPLRQPAQGHRPGTGQSGQGSPPVVQRILPAATSTLSDAMSSMPPPVRCRRRPAGYLR